VEAKEPEIQDVCDSIADFLAGSDVVFSLDTIHLDVCSPFQRSVLEAEHKIPRGMVSTYQRIARHLGRPSAARAVGTALATNPFPIIIPCHRAIRSDRSLGGYQGGIPMKRKLLKMEGIRFDSAGKVSSGDFFY
jgi:methylated-DNA-[protein]-cysteine S-methyltransferase